MEVTVTGGDKWQKYLLKYCKEASVKAGILESATNVVNGEPIAPYAAANEFGTAHIPARPFMRNTLAEKQASWVQGYAALLKTLGPEKAAMAVGKRMAEDIQAKILSSMPPPNAPATVARKAKKQGPRGTLVDTGSMVKAVEYEVESHA